MTQDKISHCPVVAKSCFLSQEFLMQPSIAVLQHQIFAVARKRPGKTRNGIKYAFCRFQDAKGNIVADRLHFGQVVGKRIGYIGPAGYATHGFILKRLDEIANGKGIQKAVGVDKDQQFMPSQLGPYSQGFPLAHVLRLQMIPHAERL